MKYIALYNPHSDNENGKDNAIFMDIVLEFYKFELIDITTIENYKEFFNQLPQETKVVICGGDGTLNRFINETCHFIIKQPLYYWPCGSGNDFARDLGFNNELIPLNEYIKNLPVVYVNNKEYRFINGVGFGIDGYCCEIGDKMREEKPKEQINYTAIAVKGLLFHYKPTKATVIVDGKKTEYKKVWIAPTMYGKYYGGGMMPAPKQSRRNVCGQISVMIFHGCGKLKTLSIFPSIFNGEHVKKQKNVTIMQGNEITVRFDQPRTLQIDGETIKDATEYTVKSAFTVANEKSKTRLS